jgi:hypothetical protein
MCNCVETLQTETTNKPELKQQQSGDRPCRGQVQQSVAAAAAPQIAAVCQDPFKRPEFPLQKWCCQPGGRRLALAGVSESHT